MKIETEENDKKEATSDNVSSKPSTETLSDKRIDYACKNFKKINKSGNEKFTKLDKWLKKESNIFQKELIYTPKQFMKYKKGTIVKVDFGINIGCELSHTHFAIVMDNEDNCYKETISVIPLTSKPGDYKIDLGFLLFDAFIDKMNMELENADSDVDIDEIKKLIIEYSKYKKLTFANVSQFRCISKNRILYPLNKHDLVGKTRVAKNITDKLTSGLIDLYF